MPRKTRNQVHAGRFFRWLLVQRAGVFYADGRSNRPPLGRSSLGTRDRQKATRRLAELDLAKAIELGLADHALLEKSENALVDLQKGYEIYRQHLARPEVVGGASTKTIQRYKAVADKFIPFAESRGAFHWNSVTKTLLVDYLTNLTKREYAYRTLYLEGTCVLQIVKWLVLAKHIPQTCRFSLKLRKEVETTAYCWKPDEVAAMLDHCRSDPDLRWVADVLIALTHTGVRIAELAALRWSDIDLDAGTIRLSNDRAGRNAPSTEARRTKNRRDRSLPIHPQLRTVLEQLTRRSDGRIFHGPRGGRLKPDGLRNVLVAKVIAPLKERFPTPKGELGFEHGRLHSCRHYFCSRAAIKGIPERVVMQWVGHRDSAMVRYYFHLHDLEGKRLMNSLTLLGDDDGSGAVDQSSAVSK